MATRGGGDGGGEGGGDDGGGGEGGGGQVARVVVMVAAKPKAARWGGRPGARPRARRAAVTVRRPPDVLHARVKPSASLCDKCRECGSLVKPTHVTDACTSGPSMYEVNTLLV